MVHRTDMVMVWVEDTGEDVLNAILTSGRSRFPVYREDADDIVGILNTRDFLLNAQEDAPKTLAGLIRPAYFVPDVGAQTCCSGICRAKRYIWPLWWTSTAAPRAL